MNESKKSLVINRIFDASLATVWKYWIQPELIKKWWGPKMFSCPESKIDFRVGGKYLHCMHGMDGLPPEMAGKDFWSTGTYKEIFPMKKIVATDSFADEHGNIVPSTHYGMEGFPLEMLVTFEFEEQNGKTKMTLTHTGIENIDEKALDGMNQGWNQSFDKLASLVFDESKRAEHLTKT